MRSSHEFQAVAAAVAAALVLALGACRGTPTTPDDALTCTGAASCETAPPVDGAACCASPAEGCIYDCGASADVTGTVTTTARRCDCVAGVWSCHVIPCGDAGAADAGRDAT